MSRPPSSCSAAVSLTVDPIEQSLEGYPFANLVDEPRRVGIIMKPLRAIVQDRRLQVGVVGIADDSRNAVVASAEGRNAADDRILGGTGTVRHDRPFIVEYLMQVPAYWQKVAIGLVLLISVSVTALQHSFATRRVHTVDVD